jgi:leader peptidase (prepilin peptidase)/N-methyltransferase
MNIDIIFYTLIFIIGTLFGSFYTLAVYRIPKRENITHKHSYCPNCNHKLGFFELIPILSYVFLGGKCKSCKQKIRIRYLILEVLTGALFVLFAYALGISYTNFSIKAVISFVFIILYITGIILIASIDKENRKIERPILAYLVVISIIYIIYLCIIEKASIYRYIICLATLGILLTLDTIELRSFAKNNYAVENIILLNVMLIFTDFYVAINTVIVTALAIAIYLLLEKIKNKSKAKKQEEKIIKNVKFGYLFGISNLMLFAYVLLLTKYFII